MSNLTLLRYFCSSWLILLQTNISISLRWKSFQFFNNYPSILFFYKFPSFDFKDPFDKNVLCLFISLVLPTVPMMLILVFALFFELFLYFLYLIFAFNDLYSVPFHRIVSFSFFWEFHYIHFFFIVSLSLKWLRSLISLLHLLMCFTLNLQPIKVIFAFNSVSIHFVTNWIFRIEF